MTDAAIDKVFNALDNVETALYASQQEVSKFKENWKNYTNGEDLVGAFKRVIQTNQALFNTIKPTDDHIKMLGLALDPVLKKFKEAEKND